MRGDLLKSTPFRMTLLLSAIFLVSLGLAAISAVQLIRQELAVRVDAALYDAFTVISQSYGDSDINDLTASVQSHARATIGHDQLFRLTDAKGAVIAGNVGVANVPQGWSTQPAKSLGLSDPVDYRLFASSVGGNALLVGASSAESDAVATLTLTAFAWAAAIFTALVVAAGSFIAVRAQRRLDGIAGTMRRIGQGELAARIPVGRRNDDVDALSTQVNAALDRLGALVEGMRQVSVDIAHDLKTPLNRLAITIETAIDADVAGQPVAALLAQAEEEGRQINATFDALLRIAQIEAGSRRERFALLPLLPLLESIVEIYAEVALERGQTLTLLPPRGTIFQIRGDRELLVQLFVNLVENALRHGGDGVSVTLAIEGQAHQTIVRVADTGPGIPDDERNKVFRRLYRLDKSRSTPGSGLGLSLVKAIADLHGAPIDLIDNGPGLTVILRFRTEA
jgi:signal transduction histidine kinase